MMLSFFILGYFQPAVACSTFVVNNVSLNTKDVSLFTFKLIPND